MKCPNCGRDMYRVKNVGGPDYWVCGWCATVVED
jgi:hypothetical protein